MLIGLKDRVLLEQAYLNVYNRIEHEELWLENFGIVNQPAYISIAQRKRWAIAKQAKAAGAWLNEDGEPQLFIRGGNELTRTELTDPSFWTLSNKSGDRIAKGYRDTAGVAMGRNSLTEAERLAQNKIIFNYYRTLPQKLKNYIALSAAFRVSGFGHAGHHYNDDHDTFFERIFEIIIKKWQSSAPDYIPGFYDALKARDWDKVMTLSEPKIHFAFEVSPIGYSYGEIKNILGDEEYDKYKKFTDPDWYFEPFRSITKAYLIFKNPMYVDGIGKINPDSVRKAKEEGYDAIWNRSGVGHNQKNFGVPQVQPEIAVFNPKESVIIVQKVNGKTPGTKYGNTESNY